MWLIFRGIANFVAALPLAAAGVYSLLWAIFFLLEGLWGHSFEGYVPLQLVVAGLLCLVAALMVFTFAIFLGARGWYLVRRRWPAVPKVTINPVALKAVAKLSWIAPAVGGLATIPPYMAIWGWPDRSAIPYLGIYFGIIIAAFVPSVIVHELLHAVGWWIAGRVPSNQLRFGVAPRLGAAYAYTHTDMTVRGYQVGAVLPALVLGVLPAYGGLILEQPILLAYGLLMLHVATGDFFLLWRTLAFPASVSFDWCAEQDEMLAAFVQAEQA